MKAPVFCLRLGAGKAGDGCKACRDCKACGGGFSSSCSCAVAAGCALGGVVCKVEGAAGGCCKAGCKACCEAEEYIGFIGMSLPPTFSILAGAPCAAACLGVCAGGILGLGGTGGAFACDKAEKGWEGGAVFAPACVDGCCGKACSVPCCQLAMLPAINVAAGEGGAVALCACAACIWAAGPFFEEGSLRKCAALPRDSNASCAVSAFFLPNTIPKEVFSIEIGESVVAAAAGC